MELSRLGAELNLGAASSEWTVVVLYAEAHGMFGPASEKVDSERLGVISERLDSMSKQVVALDATMRGLVPDAGARSEAGLFRDLCAFGLALLVCVAGVVTTSSAGSPLALIAAMALGVCLALAYVWLAPIIGGAIRRLR
jgi:hypothetical protein